MLSEVLHSSNTRCVSCLCCSSGSRKSGSALLGTHAQQTNAANRTLETPHGGSTSVSGNAPANRYHSAVYHSTSGVPGQPIAQDASMPLLSPNYVVAQLEEASRRLLDQHQPQQQLHNTSHHHHHHHQQQQQQQLKTAR